MKFDFGWGSARDPAGELKCSPDLLAGFKGPTSKGRKERCGRREGEKKGGKGVPYFQFSLLATLEGKGEETKKRGTEGTCLKNFSLE